MNIFLCKKCDKLTEEKTININNKTEENKFKNEIYYCNSLYNSYFSSIKYMNVANNSSYKLQNQSDELQIIDYSYEKGIESQNNYSKSTLKKYNFDNNNDDINEVQIKSSSIKEIYSNLNNKKKCINNKKKILIYNDNLKTNNNFESYFLKNNQNQLITNNVDIKENNSMKRYNKNKSKLNKVKLNKNLNNTKNNSWTQSKTNNSFFQKGIEFNNKKNINYKENNINEKSEKKNNSNKNNYKNKCIYLNNIKPKKENTILINEMICKKLKKINSSINKKNNLKGDTIFSSNPKKSTSNIIKISIKNEKKNPIKEKNKVNENKMITKINKSIS